MRILPLEFYRNGEMTEAFALGGTLAEDAIDKTKSYPSSLQNYLIDTGSEIILVDTGLPVETKPMERKPGQMLYMGDKVADFTTALKNTGYKPEDISKVIITHKHPDHSGEIRLFSHADIFISRIEADAMKLDGSNIQRIDFKDGAYKNFPESKEIAEHIHMLPAYGHTNGNSIVIAELDGLYFMIHGDITYTDEALRRNHLSVVFENKDSAKESLEKVRRFISENDTVYLSTHTPEALKSLENKTIMKL